MSARNRNRLAALCTVADAVVAGVLLAHGQYVVGVLLVLAAFVWVPTLRP